jgi:ABC-2 type transport system ATP-binding protein
MISIRNISKSFANLKAVDDLVLEVPKGELFCFLGPNGAGKTTTIKMLTGLMRPDSGNISISGIDVLANPVEAKKHIGYIPDMPFIYDRLTPEEFMEFTADIYHISTEDLTTRREELFTTFGVHDFKSALIRDISHGMRQRLIYAATFLHQPDVLFIDEPLIGLDPYTIRLIKDLLKRKAREGMTIFLTTHILALAEDIGDRIGIINEGKVIALGTLEEIKSDFNITGNLENVFLGLTSAEEVIHKK